MKIIMSVDLDEEDLQFLKEDFGFRKEEFEESKISFRLVELLRSQISYKKEILHMKNLSERSLELLNKQDKLNDEEIQEYKTILETLMKYYSLKKSEALHADLDLGRLRLYANHINDDK